MTRIVNNKLLHPTSRKIKNWQSDFMTSDGPNTTSLISLLDLGIPYDSHYSSRIVLPAGSENFYLNYGLLQDITFLLIKVTYNGNYDKPNEDDFDPLYQYEPNNYNITFYFEDNTGKTYPIGRLLILNGSLNKKIPKIYLNNPLDYDVVLDVLQANIDAPKAIPPSSAITISNLYFSDIITNQVACSISNATTTTTSTTISPTTTTTTIYPTTTTTTTALSGLTGITSTTTTTIAKKLMKIKRSSYDKYIRYSSSGGVYGLFDYLKDGEWIFAGELTNSVDFTDLVGIERIRFYFDLNTEYYGTIKSDSYEPLDHNTGLYFVDTDIYGDAIMAVPGYHFSGTFSSGTFSSTSPGYYGLYGGPYTGSTAFIIKEYVIVGTGSTIQEYFVPYSTILSMQKNISINTIYLNTITIAYTLIFLTDFDCNQAFARMNFAYTSYLEDYCRYLTEDNVYNNGSALSCSPATGYTGINLNPPIIYYNSPSSGASWDGSGTTIPHDVYLHLVNSGVTGWTLDSLKLLFIDKVTDCFEGDVPLSAITFNLYKTGSDVNLTGITESDFYDIEISYTDTAGNTTTHYISNITVDDDPPVIVYKPYLIVPYLTGNTTAFSGASSAITSGITIYSGFTLNLGGFDRNVISRLDIIDNIVNYVYDFIDTDINKYMLDVLIAGFHVTGSTTEILTFTGVTAPGNYCVKISIKDSGGNEITDYLIMKVIFDVTVYSEGFWQDDKVWVDFVLWLDHPIIPER